MSNHGMSSIPAQIAFVGVGALMEFENSMRRHRAMQAAANTQDAFTSLRNELVYERCLNDALITKISQLEAEILLLEEQLEEE